jgi:hypothetical protein
MKQPGNSLSQLMSHVIAVAKERHEGDLCIMRDSLGAWTIRFQEPSWPEPPTICGPTLIDALIEALKAENVTP